MLLLLSFRKPGVCERRQRRGLGVASSTRACGIKRYLWVVGACCKLRGGVISFPSISRSVSTGCERDFQQGQKVVGRPLGRPLLGRGGWAGLPGGLSAAQAAGLMVQEPGGLQPGSAGLRGGLFPAPHAVGVLGAFSAGASPPCACLHAAVFPVRPFPPLSRGTSPVALAPP